MDVAGSVALVTGANRGLGAAFAKGLLAAGAKTVYGGARKPFTSDTPGLVPVELDVTNDAQVSALAAELGDVNLLINNAGIVHGGPALGPDAEAAFRADFETNVLGTLAVTRAFAPGVVAAGGGAVVNILSVMSWVTILGAGSYAASKAAAWQLTNALRLELRPDGVLVVGVHAGYLDTDMAAHIPSGKTAPDDVVRQVLDALAAGREEVLIDDLSRNVKAGLAGDVTTLYPVASGA